MCDKSRLNRDNLMNLRPKRPHYPHICKIDHKKPPLVPIYAKLAQKWTKNTPFCMILACFGLFLRYFCKHLTKIEKHLTKIVKHLTKTIQIIKTFDQNYTSVVISFRKLLISQVNCLIKWWWGVVAWYFSILWNLEIPAYKLNQEGIDDLIKIVKVVKWGRLYIKSRRISIFVKFQKNTSNNTCSKYYKIYQKLKNHKTKMMMMSWLP